MEGSAPLSCGSLRLSVCLSSFGDSSSLRDFTSLRGLRSAVDFSVCSALLVVRIEWQLLSLGVKPETRSL